MNNRAEPIRLFVGYDRREPVVNWVFKHSVLQHTSMPVAFHDLSIRQLQDMGLWWRARDSRQSTDFSFTRFLVPWLCGYEGWAIFADGDMLCRDDLVKLWALRDDRYAVRVVKHAYEPVENRKFLGQEQTKYPMKNWSSVMLFNNRLCGALRPETVNVKSAAWLHEFDWVRASAEVIGDLPRKYNHLVGVYPHDPDAAIVHFTIGAPVFEEYKDSDYADEWREAYKQLTYCEQKE